MSPSESFNMAIMALNTFEVGSAPPYFDMNLQVILTMHLEEDCNSPHN